MANYLAARSSNLSSFNAIAMNYSTLTVSTLSGVSTLNVSRVITTSTIQVNSSMISLGASTNQVYISSLSHGNFSTATTWVTSMTNRLSTATIAMSANAQYQMTVSPSTTVSSIMYTSTLGTSWTTLTGATGLPTPAGATSYTAGAISGDGRCGLLGAYGGYLYTTANSGQSWTNTNPNIGSLYAQLSFEGNTNDVSGNGRTVTAAGSPGYVTGIVGTRAINLVNASATVQTQSVTIPWTGATNFTISGWFNVQSVWPSTYNTNIFSAYNGSFALTIGPSVDSSLLRWFIPSGGSNNVQLVTNSLTIALNTWYNYTAIFQTGGLCSLYLNNTLVGTYTNTNGVGTYTTTSILLGGYDLPHAPGNSFNGYLDDFKVYNAAITPTPMVPQNWSNVAVSNTGQYMLATVTGAGLYMSSNFGSTWTQVSGTLLTALWSAAQVSATGQYMLAYSTPVMVQPQLAGLSGASWQVNGISWNVSASSTLAGAFYTYNAFNNAPGGTTWASADLKYNTSTGAYIGSTSTYVNGQGSVNGEWLQIQSSGSVQMQSYTFQANDRFQYMNGLTIAGSNDGINWYLLQSVVMSGNPCGVTNSASSTSYIIVNQSGSQTMTTTGGSATFTCTISSYSANSYTYFRLICPASFGAGLVAITQWYIRFQAGGQTYSTNYGSTWNNGYALPTPTALSLSESGQYALGSNTPLPYSQLNFENNYVDSANGLATGVLSGTTANVTFSSTSKVGTSSLSVANTAAGTTNLGYVNYTIPSDSPLRLPNALTIAMWINPNSTTGQSCPLGFNNGSTGAGPYFYLSSTMAFSYYTTTQQFGAITSSSTIPTGSWTHVAITLSGGILTLYINGASQASTTITGSLALGNTWNSITNMFIGCLYTAGGGYNGLIDDVRIYPYPLLASTINALYLLSAPVVYVTSNFLQGFSTGTSTTPTFQTALGTGNVPVATAVSNTGQYMVLITNNTSGNNVYYSTNFGAFFTALALGTQVLTSCAISYDGSYITVSNATTTWTLNNNSNGFSVALGNQAGYQNQANNAIAIGNYAGYQNQTANSIILNATGSAVNAFAPGFYVAPIAAYTASSSQSFALLGYGIGMGGDNQVVQTANITMSNNIMTINNALILNNTLILNETIYGKTAAGAAFWMQSNGGSSLYITDSQNIPTAGITTYGRYFGVSGVIYQDFFNLYQWRGCNVQGAVTAANAMSLSSAGNLSIAGSIFTNGSITFGGSGSIYSGDGNAYINLISSGSGGFQVYTNNGGSSGGLFSSVIIASASSGGTQAAYQNIYHGNGSANGTAYLQFVYNGNVIGSITQSGTGNVAFNASSDYRLKSNVKPIDTPLNTLQKLKPCAFSWTNDNVEDIGFIAHEFADVFPNKVINKKDEVDEEGKPKHQQMSSSVCIPLLVSCVQEQQSEITDLKAQLSSLKATIDILLSKINN
jgi:hypothetical protein